MTKLYYTDTLAAAIMARDFGVKMFLDDEEALDEGCIDEEAWYELLAWTRGGEETFYIHPDSYDIFEPQVGDVVTYGHFTQTLVDDVSDDADDVERNVFMPLNDYDLDDNKIIQRNNKPFFTPEKED